MTKEEFPLFLARLSSELRLDEPLGAEGELTIGDVEMALRYDPGHGFPKVRLLVDMGDLAELDHTAALRTLLEMNLSMDPADQGVLGFDEESGHALLSAAFDLDDDLDPNTFAMLLHQYPDYVAQVREHLNESAASATSGNGAYSSQQHLMI